MLAALLGVPEPARTGEGECGACQVLCQVQTASAWRVKSGYVGYWAGQARNSYLTKVYRTKVDDWSDTLTGVSVSPPTSTSYTYHDTITTTHPKHAPFAAQSCPGAPAQTGTPQQTGSVSAGGSTSCNATLSPATPPQGGWVWSDGGACYGTMSALFDSPIWSRTTTQTADQDALQVSVFTGSGFGNNAGSSYTYTHTETLSGLYETQTVIDEVLDDVQSVAYPGAWSAGVGDASTILCGGDMGAVVSKLKYRFQVQTDPDKVYRLEWDEMELSSQGEPTPVSKNTTLDGVGGVVTTPEFEAFPPRKAGRKYVTNLRMKYKEKGSPGGTPGSGGP